MEFSPRFPRKEVGGGSKYKRVVPTVYLNWNQLAEEEEDQSFKDIQELFFSNHPKKQEIEKYFCEQWRIWTFLADIITDIQDLFESSQEARNEKSTLANNEEFEYF